jgi:hypothetical protein
MARFDVTPSGAILAVADFERSLAFYRDTRFCVDPDR